MKVGDVYRFSWNDKHRPSQDAYWCFDGQFVTIEIDGKLFLRDTYWPDSSGKTWTPQVATERGELKFVCNMNEVERVNEREFKYYDERDVFNLSRQHGCYKEFYKRKGALRSKAAMLALLQKEAEDAHSQIRSATSLLEYLKDRQQVIEQTEDLSNEYI